MATCRPFFIGFFIVFCLLCFNLQHGAHADLIDTQTGVSGTPSDDTIENSDPVDLNVSLGTTSSDYVTTTGIGIDGLSGYDDISNNAAISTVTESDIIVPAPEILSLGSGSTSNSSGITGGDGSDTLRNTATIDTSATSVTDIFELTLLVDIGILNLPTTAEANAFGIQGGDAPDTISNSSNVTVNADSDSSVVGIKANAVAVPIDTMGKGNGQTIAQSLAIGIDGDMQTGTPSESSDSEQISSSGAISATATATSTATLVSAELVGAARIDNSTEAKAYSAGIFGGVNDNEITNTGSIHTESTATSDMTSVEIKMKGLMLKPALDLFGVDVGKYTTTADALAVGVFGNDGDDALYNYGSGGMGSMDVAAHANADSKLFTFSISPPKGGGDETPSDVSTMSTFLPDLAFVTTSEQTLGNGSIAAYGDARTVAAANALGMAGDQGDDTLESSVSLTSAADATASNLALSVDINIDKTSYIPLPGAAVSDTSTTALAVSHGLDGGTGNDIINNSSALNAVATTDANSLSIAATVKGSMKGINAGVAITDSSSAAISSTKGIIGGTGGDTITNSGSVMAYSEAEDDATSISVTLAGDKYGVAAGVSLADAITRANAYSIGIDGENADNDESASIPTQIDDITNSGEIWSTAIADAHAVSVATSFGASLEGVGVSVSLVESDVKSESRAIGIRSGIGEDRIENTNTYGIHTSSTAKSTSESVSVAVSGSYKGVAMGATYAEANTQAAADAIGIDAGASNDTILNHADMDTTSTATVGSDTVAVTAAVAIYGFSAGAAMSNAQTNSDADAVGINAGDGDDSVDNTAIMTTTASAYTETDTVTINFAEAGAAIADVSSKANAESVGINASNGVDDVTNTGTLTVSAASVSDDTSTVVNIAGYARGDIGSTSTASAVGIAGGQGTAGETEGDTLKNNTGGNITVTSTANAYSNNYVVQGGGVELAKLGSETLSSATAIKAGDLGDTIENDGTATSTAYSDINASNFNFSLFGIQVGSVGVNAIGTARGIDAGGGENTITNKANGIINTYADISTTSLNTEVSIGAHFVHSGVTSDAYSQGVVSGDAADTILNDGTISATANSLGQAAGASIGLISLSLVNALADAEIEGINGNGADDTITNNGTISAGAIHTGDDFVAKAETAAVAFDFVSFISTSLGAEAHITGIQGASGDDTLTNNGIIYIGDETPYDTCTENHSMVIGDSYSFGGQWLGLAFAFSGTSARAFSTGMDGGIGNDTLSNSGSVTVKARSYGDVGAEVYLGLGLTDSMANAKVKSTADAIGIYGNEGEDIITNHGTITADALTIADSQTWATVDLATEPEAKSEATAVATASGIHAGAKGVKTIDNYNTITSLANAGAWTRMHSTTTDKRSHTSGYGLAQSQAYGITSESLSNTATNQGTGTITVTALAGTYDTLGNTGYAFAEEDANIDAGYYNPSTQKWTPVSAEAGGIVFLSGDDVIVNDGTITVTSNVNGTVYANSNCWVRYPFSTARSVVFSQSKGIAAGQGENNVVNNGQLIVQSLSHSQPKVYSWTRDYRATATAEGTSSTEAIGIEADGNMLNASYGVMDVTARATSWAHAGTRSENVDVTAVLNATATGFGPATSTGRTGLLSITNNGIAKVNALAGENDNGLSQQIAWVNTNISVRDDTGNCTGISTVDAAGVRAGDGAKEITNNGTLKVLGRARADLTTASGAHTYVRSRDYNPEANSYATGNATATGVLITGGENHIFNNGTMDVQAQALDVYAWSDTYSSWSTCYSTADTHATSNGQGIVTGNGNDEIVNAKTLSVTSYANSHSYAYADTRDNNLADEYETSWASSTANAMGINGGDGYNAIENQDTLSVSATSLAQVYAGGGHASVNAITYSTATGIGIYGGEDGSYIHNSGSIDVTAKAYYINGRPTLGVATTGILGGIGDDTIINEGTITTAMGSGVWTSTGILSMSSGIGIDTGGGNDTLDLRDGSSITGSVELGDGDDTLILRGTPIIIGTLDPGTGDNGLIFDGDGSYDMTFSGYHHASKIAYGTYTIAGLNPMSELTMFTGKLKVNSDYQFSDSGLFYSRIYTDGSCGQFEIAGAGELDGELLIEKQDALYSQAMTYDVIVADALTGGFSDIALPESTSLLVFSFEQAPDAVHISATPLSFTSVAKNNVERAIGKYMDRIAPDAQGDLASVLKTFQLLSPDQFKTAFSGFSPANLGVMSDIGHHVVQSAIQPITSHLQTKQQSASTLSFAPKTPVLLSSNYSGHLPGASENSSPQGKSNSFGVWAKGFGRWGNQESSEGFNGYDFSTYGGAVGMDYAFNNGLIGVSFERSNAFQDFNSDSGCGIIHTVLTSLYADIYLDHFSIESIITYGWQEYENKRNIIIGDILRQAVSNHDSNLFSAYLGGAYHLSKGMWSFAPFANIQYTLIDEDAFSESGAADLNLVINEKTTKAMVSQLGVQASRPFNRRSGYLVPKISLAGIYDFDIDDRAITAGFAGSPDDTFTIGSQDIDQFGVALEAELSRIYDNGFGMSINYSGEFRKSYTSQRISGMIGSRKGFSTSIGYANNFQEGHPEEVLLGEIKIRF